MTNNKTVTCRAWMRGADDPIEDQSLVAKADFISISRNVMDEDTFKDRLDKANFKYEAIYPSKSGKAWNAYRVGYSDDYGEKAPIVGLTI